MKVLDLFSGAGGSSMGFHRAGFEVVGVDINPQPRYPFEFHQADWFEYLLEHWFEFDLIAASPPCQKYIPMSNGNHPDLIENVREAIKATDKPYVIENVPQAPLVNPLTLCGTMFNLRVIRHRCFETSPTIWFPPYSCNHWGKSGSCFEKDEAGKRVYHSFDNCDFIPVVGHSFRKKDGEVAMDINWMTRAELIQAIPPAFTEFIGNQMKKLIGE